MKAAVVLLIMCSVVIVTGCGGGGASTSAPQPTVNVQLSSSALQVSQTGDTANVTVTVTSSGTSTPVTLSVTGAPAGVSISVTQPGSSNMGALSFSVTKPSTAPAATYALQVRGSSGATVGVAPLSLLVTGLVTIGGNVAGNTAFMSTSFQVADYSYAWLTDHPAAIAPLVSLSPQHVRVQVLDGALPETAQDQWNFTELDAIVQPLLANGDQSPQLQIGAAPAFMYNSSGALRDQTFQEFAGFCANLVRYYNKGGFTSGSNTYQSPSSTPIRWWGIYNEPNINNVTADQYVALYNAAGAAMLAVDPSIKLVALELSDWGTQPQTFLPPLLAGATAPIHAVATHYYGTCSQKDTDQTVMDSVSMFATHASYFRSTLDANTPTVGTPLWVTENNVNADWNNNGKSACNPSQAFVSDPRGSSAFFAAWRPLVYSQLVKAGTAGVWHWSYAGDAQYGEVDGNGNKQLSYWVDYYLSNWLPSTATLLSATSSDDGVEVLAALRSDGRKVIMVANHQVGSANDNNGPGVAKTITLDLSQAGSYSAASLVAMDATTNPAAGPVPVAITPAQQLELKFSGYGVQFLMIGENQ
jgi:hypothetical protein